MTKTVRTLLAGLGNVNRNLLKLLIDKEEYITSKGLNFVVVGVADSSGVALSPSGFDKKTLLSKKADGLKVNNLDGFDRNIPAEQMAQQIDAELLVEATPVNLESGSPGLSITRHALDKGLNVVLANKGPMVLAFDELINKAKGRIAYSATVCGGLPVLNVLTRDLKGASLKSLQGIFNATSNFVLQELGNGNSMEDAVAEAQRVGAAETDPSHDLNGNDTANKLFIIMKTFSSFKGTIKDINVEGIMEVDQKMIWQAKQQNQVIKLIAEAKQEDGEWKLSVRPKRIPVHSFLGSCNGWEMGIEVKTDIYESISMKNYEADPVGTAAAVLRDMIDLSNQ